MPKGQWSKAALQQRYAAQAEDEDLLSCARDYALGHNIVLCTVCKDIKRSECRKAKCVAAKAPLMLTMAP